ncbi:MAG: ribonuclease HI [Microbacteriaceae bacterium]|nr:ribonuclease HI [Microbacteriaceae bacterium]
MQITAAADGSSLGNPGPAGWAWVTEQGEWRAGGWPRGTNNMGELMAVADLLEQTADLDASLRVLCDSQYVINSVTKWMPGWKRKGWKKSDGKPVQNRELLERIDAALAGRDVRFEWVRGHSGHDLNEQADARARGAAESYAAGREPDAGPGLSAARGGRAAGAGGQEAGPGGREVEPVEAGADPSTGSGASGAGTSGAGASEPALFDDLFFADEPEAPRPDAGGDARDAEAELRILIARLEAGDARDRRHDAFEQVGRAAADAAADADGVRVELVAPGVAVARSAVDGVERTSLWLRDGARHDAEWLLRLRHDG